MPVVFAVGIFGSVVGAALLLLVAAVIFFKGVIAKTTRFELTEKTLQAEEMALVRSRYTSVEWKDLKEVRVQQVSEKEIVFWRVILLADKPTTILETPWEEDALFLGKMIAKRHNKPLEVWKMSDGTELF